MFPVETELQLRKSDGKGAVTTLKSLIDSKLGSGSQSGAGGVVNDERFLIFKIVADSIVISGKAPASSTLRVGLMPGACHFGTSICPGPHASAQVGAHTHTRGPMAMLLIVGGLRAVRSGSAQARVRCPRPSGPPLHCSHACHGAGCPHWPMRLGPSR